MDRQAVNSVIRAAVVALVVFIAFQFFFGKREAGNSLKEVKAVKEVEVKLPVPPSKELGKVVKVDTPLYRAEISTVNGKVVSLFVKQYGAQLISDASKKFGIFPLMTISDDKALSAELSALELTPDKELIEVKDAPRKLVLTGKLKDGRVFKKIFTFYPDSYRIDFSAELEGANLETLIGLDIKVNEVRSSHMGHVGPVLETEREIVRLKPEEITPFLSFGKVIWAGEEDKYFLLAVKDSVFSVTVENLKGHTLVRNFVSNGVFYGGPKELNRLESLGMDAAIDFGIFGFLAKPMLKFFLFLHRFIPNWGVVIIVLTVIVKLLLHPLAHKSYVSMKKMQELAPKLEEIKKRYGKDPQKLQEETMKLYREAGVNPASGCLPMLLQIPIFFALYEIFLNAVELKGASFLWIKDLSLPDPTYILPVLMGASMIAQQFLTPTANKEQQKIFLIMAVVFTFLFATFPAGLVLYWFTNNVITALQNLVIMKVMERAG